MFSVSQLIEDLSTVLKGTGTVGFFKNLLKKWQRNTTIAVSTKVSINEKASGSWSGRKHTGGVFCCKLIENLSTFLKETGAVGFFWKSFKKMEKKQHFCCL